MNKFKEACNGGQSDLKQKSNTRFGFTQNRMGLPESMIVLHAATIGARHFYKHIGKAESLDIKKLSLDTSQILRSFNLMTNKKVSERTCAT